MLKETRITLRNVGKIDPESLADYRNAGGYAAYEKAKHIDQEQLISEIEKSGRLRGRGGAGFNTGLKWRGAWQTSADQKYVICNADEGEPGTYKDRIVLEGDPHSILEGMLICAYAIGAKDCYLYIRGEYQNAQRLMRRAIEQLEESGIGDGVRFRIVSGAGSYVCGEETALIESIEGHRGEPRLKPPFPTQAGLFGKPTVVNNVETFASIPSIVEKGADWFSGIGASGYPGTKIVSLSGDVVNRAYFEIPTDATVRQVVYELGGGVANGRKLKAVQVGGTTCGFLTESMLDVHIDFDSMRGAGASLGSGAVLVIDDTHNMVDIIATITQFLAHESCGKCLACREGSRRMAELIEKFRVGHGTREDLASIERLAGYLQNAPFCPLGQSVPIPVLSGLKLFREDFESRMSGKV